MSILKNSSIGIVYLAGIISGPAFCLGYNSNADEKAVIIRDDIRITVLTSGCLRLEWAEDKKFEDRASLTFINRKTETPNFSVEEKNGFLEVVTDKLLLRYKLGTGKFTKDNLTIDVNTAGIKTKWHFGDIDDKNLLGTARTLDQFNGSWNMSENKEIELCHGLISRNGWTFVDDSNNPVFDNSEWPWVTPRPQGQKQDVYFFGYGYDYKTAMKDFITVAGRIALPPKFAFGVWWSKYWNYDDQQMRDLIEQFKRYDLGLDVLVIDMDWHITSLPEWYDANGVEQEDQAGQSSGWTGFTWNKNYFPYPEKFLKWTNENSIKTCLNIHPASGIQPHEEQYEQFAKRMGIDPNTKKYVPFDIVNKEFAQNYMELLLHPMEKMGVDFWWLDWQQWSTTKIEGVNPTFYLNYVHFSDMERQNTKRPLIFHRWGGLGNHRYQIGFSGDTIITWESLAYQPYFTSTASNVGFGFWSHDIGGHYCRNGIGFPHNPELYTRWIQWGIFSPVFRTHSTADPNIERRPWAYPMEYFQAMRASYDLRYALLPYIYTSARQAYDTGISICRPMYYDWPENEEAYSFKTEYMFGDSLLVNPVASPIENGKKFVMQKTWLPKGTWVEFETGKVFQGPAVIERPFAIDEIPVYVKAGSIIPLTHDIKRIDDKPFEDIILDVYPGEKGSFSLYEDAGNDNNYKDGKFAFTDITSEYQEGKTVITINPVKGGFDNMLTQRKYQIRLVNTYPPKSVKLNDVEISYNSESAENCWSYEGSNVSTIINIGKQDLKQNISVVVEHDIADVSLLSGFKGKLKHLRNFVDFAGRPKDPRYIYEPIVSTSLTGRKMTYEPNKAVELIGNFDRDYNKAVEIIKSMKSKENEWKPYLDWLEIK